MRQIELSNDKARTLAGLLAKHWASLAIRLEASNVAVNTPFRCMGEGSKNPAFLRRVATARTEAKAIGDFLVELGAELPKVERDKVVAPYRSPIVKGTRIVGYQRKKYEQAISGPRRAAEHDRLVKAILDGVG